MKYTKEKKVIRRYYAGAIFGYRINSYGEIYFRFSIPDLPHKLAKELSKLGYRIDNMTNVTTPGTINMQATNMPVYELF